MLLNPLIYCDCIRGLLSKFRNCTAPARNFLIIAWESAKKWFRYSRRKDGMGNWGSSRPTSVWPVWRRFRTSLPRRDFVWFPEELHQRFQPHWSFSQSPPFTPSLTSFLLIFFLVTAYVTLTPSLTSFPSLSCLSSLLSFPFPSLPPSLSALIFSSSPWPMSADPTSHAHSAWGHRKAFTSPMRALANRNASWVSEISPNSSWELKGSGEGFARLLPTRSNEPMPCSAQHSTRHVTDIIKRETSAKKTRVLSFVLSHTPLTRIIFGLSQEILLSLLAMLCDVFFRDEPLKLWWCIACTLRQLPLLPSPSKSTQPSVGSLLWRLLAPVVGIFASDNRWSWLHPPQSTRFLFCVRR